MSSLNSKFYHTLIEIANAVAKIPYLKSILKPIYYPFKKLFANSQRNLFLENGLSVLQQFDKCCEDNNIEYTLAFGTLLGAVREKGFIKHDFDIDVYIWAEQYTPEIPTLFRKAGFKLIHSFLVEDGSIGREETYEYNGVPIDIFYLFKDDGQYPYCCDFITFNGCPTHRQSMNKYGGVVARRIELPISKNRIKTMFNGIELYIPENAHEILQFRYGNDYMIPNPSWSMGAENPHIRKWTDKKAYYYEP